MEWFHPALATREDLRAQVCFPKAARTSPRQKPTPDFLLVALCRLSRSQRTQRCACLCLECGRLERRVVEHGSGRQPRGRKLSQTRAGLYLRTTVIGALKWLRLKERRCRARTIRPGERWLGRRTRICVVPVGTGAEVAVSVCPLGLFVHNSTTAPGSTFETNAACVD